MAVKHVGASGDYTTLAAWKTYAQGVGTFTADETLLIDWASSSDELAHSGFRVEGFSMGSNRLFIEADTSKAAQDNASVGTNAWRYNASNGAAMKLSSGIGILFDVAIDNVTVRRLQFDRNTAFEGGIKVTGQGCIIEDNLVHIGTDFNCSYGIQAVSCDAIIRNNLVRIYTGISGANPDGISVVNSTNEVINNTVINTISGNSARGVVSANSVVTAKNNLTLGFATDAAAVTGGSFAAASKNNATDISSGSTGWPSSGRVAGLVAADTVESMADGATSGDFRTKTGAGIINVGSSEGTALGWNKVTRSGTYDIGAWQVAGAPPPPPPPPSGLGPLIRRSIYVVNPAGLIVPTRR